MLPGFKNSSLLVGPWVERTLFAPASDSTEIRQFTRETVGASLRLLREQEHLFQRLAVWS